jgi:hypothetical protein
MRNEERGKWKVERGMRKEESGKRKEERSKAPKGPNNKA